MGNTENTRPRGRPKKETIKCCHCGITQPSSKFYGVKSEFYKETYGKTPICKKCVDILYNEYASKFKKINPYNFQKNTIRRLCLNFDWYWSEELFDSAFRKFSDGRFKSVLTAYIQTLSMSQYKDMGLDEALFKIDAVGDLVPVEKDKDTSDLMDDISPEVEKHMVPTAVKNQVANKISEETKKTFGYGLLDSDYEFLQAQYEDWISRHECNSKAQEEIFKRICFTQLAIHKKTLNAEDTKDLDLTLIKLMDSAKLQPKQASSEDVSSAQSFGVLLDKYENTRPLPGVDEELKDVDHIGRYLDVFFKGHLAKMMNLKNAVTEMYDKFIQKYTVTRPEKIESDDTEELFDALFGQESSDE